MAGLKALFDGQAVNGTIDMRYTCRVHAARLTWKFRWSARNIRVPESCPGTPWPPRSISYFDFSSPYSYVASEEIEALAERHGREICWRPMLLGAVFSRRQHATDA